MRSRGGEKSAGCVLAVEPVVDARGARVSVASVVLAGSAGASHLRPTGDDTPIDTQNLVVRCPKTGAVVQHHRAVETSRPVRDMPLHPL
jgi:hypothetical protein